ncbi:hypothetical protein [Streptomyces sp. NPDC048508]|uniref:hypothetical protein n=1 Tax=Streptomyces sp. NPDC048508 TaxID=3365561 RepID=UPI00371281F6
MSDKRGHSVNVLTGRQKFVRRKGLADVLSADTDTVVIGPANVNLTEGINRVVYA